MGGGANLKALVLLVEARTLQGSMNTVCHSQCQIWLDMKWITQEFY